MTLAEAKEVFYLDGTSPSGIRWKIDKFCGKYNQFHCVVKGSVAGCQDKYWRVTYNYKNYHCHRIVIMLAENLEACEVDVVDHVDGDGLNNKLENLILSGTAKNMRNRKRMTSNKSGVTGAFVVSIHGRLYARAQWYDIDGSRRTKNFSHNKYGEAVAWQMAIDLRDEKFKMLQEQGAGYSDRHGK
jgi:hypothetical protein